MPTDKLQILTPIVTSVNGQAGDVTVATKTSELTNDSNFATTTYVDTKVADLVDSAPETLDTLNELSAALGDDPNFATTVANQIGTKQDKITGTKGKYLGFTADNTVGEMTLPNASTGAKGITYLVDSYERTDTDKAVTPKALNSVYKIVAGKVDKVDGKDLSTEDYTTAEKTKLAGIAEGAQKNNITSVNGQMGKVIIVKSDVGLGNVDNTSDANKPISTATQTALDTKQDTIIANGILKGDGTGNISAVEEAEVELVEITKSTIGLSNVDNTSDIDKPISTATQTALNGKQATITANGILKGDGAGNVTAITITPDTIGAASKPTAKTLSLPASSWSGKTATRAITGVTASSNIIVAAAPANYMTYAQAGVRCSVQGSGALTFVCEDTPTEDLTVNVLILG